ncbi:MAG TPA: thiamine pyrophosphate-binding protein [Bryobacteraceae bacterium]|nr:thiamine pyrophosphate-binding protein [Bryobacteraceae bacterium]
MDYEQVKYFSQRVALISREARQMNGAEALVATAISAGIEICFANPGTTELPLVQALDSVPGLRSILCLHENVTGAADGGGGAGGGPTKQWKARLGSPL